MRVVRTSFQLMLATALVVLGGGPRPAYSGDEPGDAVDPRVLRSFQQLTPHSGRFDWDSERRFLERAAKNVWERNGWTSEADRFALDVVCEVSAVPPWEPMKRLNLLAERIEGRYALSGVKRVKFRKAFMRETARFLMRNSGLLLEQTREWIDARARGEPYTPQQIARWAKESQPLLEEMRESTELMIEELEPLLEPDRRRVLERDRQSFEKRARFIGEMSVRWARGEWEPADWGLPADPAQRHGARPSAVSSVAKAAALHGAARGARTGRWHPYDPATWHVYVRGFQNRFRLIAGQVIAAESILAELVSRGNRYVDAHREALGKVPLAERMTHEVYDPIRTLFGELQHRLDAIPTSGQRERDEE